jgi:hypothetical protein
MPQRTKSALCSDAAEYNLISGRIFIASSLERKCDEGLAVEKRVLFYLTRGRGESRDDFRVSAIPNT